MYNPETENDIKQTLWSNHLMKKDYKKLIRLFRESSLQHILDFFQLHHDNKDIIKVFLLLDLKNKSLVFPELTETLQFKIYHFLSKSKFSLVFSNISTNQQADFYQKLNAKQKSQLLPYLTDDKKEELITLSEYLPHTAGGIMNTNFFTILENLTISQVIQELRATVKSAKDISYLYVINKDRQLIGFITLQDLILNDADQHITQILHKNFTYAYTHEDQEIVAQKIEQYNLLNLPVINEHFQLVGIIKQDEAIDIIRDEDTEDMERFMGIISQEDDERTYLEIPILQHFKQRAKWLLGLFIVSFISSYLMHTYEDIIKKITIIAFYLPMLADTGGNAGSQTATVIIRALALREVKLKHWTQIIFKEFKIAFLLAFCLFLLAFIKVNLMSYNFHANITINIMRMSIVIGIALGLQVITSILIGALLPLGIKLLGGDPVIAASPAITTVVDITGVLIYFTLIKYFIV